MAEDFNSVDELERRRAQFGGWLLKVWDWADDTGRPRLAEQVHELQTHVEEPDYPLWSAAEQLGIIGAGKVAKLLQKAIGLPVAGPRATSWEREINYSPVIYLEEKVWREIHGQLGWANRNTDLRIPGNNFWLWSNASNQIHFVIKPKVVMEESDVT